MLYIIQSVYKSDKKHIQSKTLSTNLQMSLQLSNINCTNVESSAQTIEQLVDRVL